MAYAKPELILAWTLIPSTPGVSYILRLPYEIVLNEDDPISITVKDEDYDVVETEDGTYATWSEMQFFDPIGLTEGTYYVIVSAGGQDEVNTIVIH